MNKDNIEIRSFSINSDAESRHISGYSVVYHSLSVDLGGFREIIEPTAITTELINRSDVVMNYNHDDSLILARSRNGEGTLRLSTDERGLLFEFDMPNSALGDQVLESIRRGDISTCSFAFSLNPDASGETWTRDDENGVIRTITAIDGLYDCALVIHAAYPETSVSARSLDKLNELKNMKENIELREDEVKDPEKEKQNEEPKEEKSENCDDNEKERSEDDPKDKETEETDTESEDKEDMKDEDTKSEDEPKDDDKDKEDMDEKDPDEKRNTKTLNKSRFNKMEKRFSLLKAIREVANNQQLDAASQAVINAGAEEMRKAGQPFGGQIQLPTELRDDPVHYTVEADGEHVVVTDYLNILEPLKAKNVLVSAGANYLTGLVGNIQIPSMTAENVYWEGEITDAKNGAGAFDHINMAPRRLSAYIDISKQFLAQDSLNCEALIRAQLVEAINDKLEATILSDAAANGTVPAGIFNGITPTDITDYASVCDFEAKLDENNFVGDFKYVINPKAKAYLRSAIKGTNATGMIMENDSIDGTAAETTTHMATDNLAYGDWSNLYIGQWGGVDLLIDNYTQATKGCVRLVINAFFDYKVVRDGAIVLGKIKRV